MSTNSRNSFQRYSSHHSYIIKNNIDGHHEKCEKSSARKSSLSKLTKY